ncbi:S-layer homology domain-containing protein [Wukongibacter sp. M2B1]|uniref:S-layer homology domain-containing protein n=1 Tax=Wukongibacter sp. M2B1 TaxID=3088895 RepID=UPI003D78BE63
MKRVSKILVVAVILTVLLITNTVGVLALQSFTDVSDNHWAKEYIEKMASKKIITGYPDATFRPSENVDKLATMVMIFRTLKATDKLAGMDISSVVKDQSRTLEQYNIPTWAEEAVAVGLEKDIIDKGDVKNFFNTDGSVKKATRTEVSIFLGRALNLYLNENLKNTIITFDFNDAEFIPSNADEYVDLLVRKKIIKGDENGNFNPGKPIVRAAVAKMFAISYDILSGIETDTNVDTGADKQKPNTSDKDLVTKEGEITVVLEDDDKLLVKEDDGESALYKIEDDTRIVIDGKSSSIKYLEEGQRIELYVDEYGRLVKIETDDSISSLEGVIYNISNMGSYYLVTVEDDDDKKRSYQTDRHTFVLLDDKDADMEDLDKGDKVSLTLDGEVIEKIIAESKKREYEGILQSNVVFDKYPKIVIKTYTQKVYELEVDDDVEVKRNSKTRKLTDLTSGDIVTVTTEYDKATKIVATSVETESKEEEGVITEIILGNEDKITIEKEDGETKTYIVASDADIEIDNDDSTINDLKVGYRVELKIENSEVTDIEAEEVEMNDSITGVITEIYDDYEAITVKVKNGSKTEYISVLAEDADIISTKGSDKSFSYLDKGDEVFIYGEEDNKIFNFIADKIIILNEN